jgi:glycosyltransferase involved in cell wall biosynthesis
LTSFSLLTSVYAKENPAHLAQCIDSVLGQTVLPDEWVIVKDGPLTEGLESVLADMRFPNELSVIALPENVTQGPARAEGLEAAKHGWVAIMDSDDICAPDRFEKQLGMIEADPRLGLIGGQIAEFSDDPAHVVAIRSVPAGHGEILRFAKRRNPFNSMTVMLRRDLALSAGNYRYFQWFEDYDLWARMISLGAACANHPDVLVHARVGAGMYGRRRGWSYIRSEWLMQRQLRALGLTNAAEFAGNVATRIPIRLLPERCLAAIYNRFARG